MEYWQLIFLFSLLQPRAHGVECPFYCQCYQQSGMNSIFCINVNRQYIPNYFDFDVKIFNFSGNSLKNLSPLDFQNQHYKSLEILDLRRNGIAKIDDKAFRRLKNLLEIDLSNNLIHFINRKMFNNNKFLNTIILSGNPIKEIKDYTFPPSIYLRHLDFQGCKIEKIHKNAFVNSPLVEYLNLKDNNLKSLSLQVLHYTTQVKYLLLEGNPWKCNRKLWLVLKWMHDRNIGKDSQLCVYGETENAVLWDTMELNHPAKFFKHNAGERVKLIKGGQESKRPRRSSGEEKRKEYDKSSYTDFDYPKVDDPPVPDMSHKQDEDFEFNKHRYNQNNFRHPDSYNPVTFHPYSNFSKGYKNYGMKLANNGYQILGSNSSYQYNFNDIQYNQESSTKIPRRRPLDYYSPVNNQRKTETPYTDRHVEVYYSDKENPPDDRHSTNFPLRNLPWKHEQPTDIPKAPLILKIIPSHWIKTSPDVIHIFPSNANGVNVNGIRPFYYANESDKINLVKGVETTTNFEESASNEDPVNMNIMLILIVIEFTLLAVLLYILYRLWRWNQEASENGVTAPLNNSSKNAKTYNTNSPGYMRYSLSDEDPSLRNNTPEDSKYDNESGYLSYHRYNSIEGENNNEFMFYRHYPRDENNDNINDDTAKSSVSERRTLEDTDRGTRNIRRNSSVRSLGRNTKTNNTFTRSISADKADQYSTIGLDEK